LGLATAGVLAFGFAEGAAVCANVSLATAAPVRNVVTATAKSRFINEFLNLARHEQQIFDMIRSENSAILNVFFLPFILSGECKDRPVSAVEIEPTFFYPNSEAGSQERN
jgi:hypothetical protein